MGKNSQPGGKGTSQLHFQVYEAQVVHSLQDVEALTKKLSWKLEATVDIKKYSGLNVSISTI